MNVERKVRLSQTIVPFGVGAVFDYRGESLVACDIHYWKNRGTIIDLPRLAAALGVDKLKHAPVVYGRFPSDRAPRVPYVRFPTWLFCGTCRRMTKWRMRDEQADEQPLCTACRRHPQLIPMRFVIACEKGHLGDFPWDWWAHGRATTPEQKQCRSKVLELRTLSGRGVGLHTLIVACKTCGSERSLQGITSTEVVKAAHITCPGKQPWQRIEERIECDESPRVLQRGASNLYFARIESAIDIPPHSEYDPFQQEVLAIASTNEFQVILSAPNGPIAASLKEALASTFGVSIQRIDQIVVEELAAQDGRPVPQAASLDELSNSEWTALLNPVEEHDHRDSFITRAVQLVPGNETPTEHEEHLDRLVDRVVLATRLREVRALTGFSRYRPDCELIRPDMGRGLDWLPAVEIFGEGLFVSFDEGRLAQWERSPAVVDRVKILEDRRRASFLGERLPQPYARFVLLHTLAHLLIRQLSFESGYPAAALRERIYARTPDQSGGPQAGLLIFTAAGDLEGTLGGLVRLGEYPHFARTLLAALEHSSWCSADPICRESQGQGFGAMNLAACHACGLVAETSCIHSNLLLDRVLAVGSPEFPEGFFSETIAAALNAAARAG